MKQKVMIGKSRHHFLQTTWKKYVILKLTTMTKIHFGGLADNFSSFHLRKIQVSKKTESKIHKSNKYYQNIIKIFLGVKQVLGFDWKIPVSKCRIYDQLHMKLLVDLQYFHGMSQDLSLFLLHLSMPQYHHW